MASAAHLSVAGEIRVPGDKSLTHRALMFSAAARGESRLSGLLPGADCRSTAAVLRSLGVQVPDLPTDGSEIRLRSGGIREWREPAEILDCGNSGTTARLMMGLLAGRPFCSTLTGDDSLRGRPMRRITDPLSKMGVRVRELDRPDRLPVELCGGELASLAYRSPKASAQIKSAVLLAGVSGGVPVSLWEPALSRDHTERMLEALGAELAAREEDGGWMVEMAAMDGDLSPLEMRVPGDPSSAAFLVSLALLAQTGELRVEGVGLNPTRTGFYDVLRRMGGSVRTADEREVAGEPVGDLIARPGRLRGVEIGAAEVPSMIDEIPMLAALAARAEGESVVRGAEELRAKESDRISAVVANLREVGVEAEELPDGLVVRGGDEPLAGRVRTHHDHRIAMAFGVLAALPGNRIEIEDPTVVDVSFPGFWEMLSAVGGRNPLEGRAS